jgi:uncharacterized protein
MPLRDELFRRRDTIRRMDARHDASNPHVFGSVSRCEGRPDSDVHLLMDLADDRGFRDYLALAEELEALLHRRVDLQLST